MSESAEKDREEEQAVVVSVKHAAPSGPIHLQTGAADGDAETSGEGQVQEMVIVKVRRWRRGTDGQRVRERERERSSCCLQVQRALRAHSKP